MNNWLENKIISCVGDSITQGVGNDNVSWTHYIEEMLPVKKVNNYGIAGTKIAYREDCEDAFVSRYLNIDENSDIIIVFGGINDFNHGFELGTRESRDIKTFYGALNTIADGLQSKFPYADILFITPMKAFGFKNYPHWNTLNKDNHRLIDYRNAMIEVAQDHSIVVLDLFSESGLTPDIKEIKENLLPDGLHPSQYGYKRLARKIANCLLYRL